MTSLAIHTADGDGPYPGVLLYPDAFSPRPRIAEMAAFAKLGPMMQALTPDRLTADAETYLDFLAGRDAVAPFAHADNDSSMTPEQVKALEAALAESGATRSSARPLLPRRAIRRGRGSSGRSRSSRTPGAPR